MSRFKKFFGRTASSVLAAVLLCQATALAAPIDELNEIMEKQNENAEESLLEQQIGFSQIGEAIKENGLEFAFSGELMPGTAEVIGVEDEIPEGAYVTFHAQVDTELEKWLLEGGVGSVEGSMLDLSLYGDAQQLALSVPQFFSGALALKAGNLREQYLASALAEILGQDAEIPDLEMSFYPEDDGEDLPFQDLGAKLEEEADNLEERMAVEKTQEDDVTVYTVSCETKDIMDIYRVIMDEYASFLTGPGLALYATGGDDAFDQDVEETITQSVEEMIDRMEAAMGEEISIRFEVKDGLVERIAYDLYMDTTALNDIEDDTVLTEVVEETLAAAGNAEDAGNPDTEGSLTEENAALAAETAALEDGLTAESDIVLDETSDNAAEDAVAELAQEILGENEPDAGITLEADEFKGYISYVVEYVNPEAPEQGFDFEMQFLDEDRQDTGIGNMKMSLTTQRDGSVEETSLSMELVAEGETLYSGTPFTMMFDSDTGYLDAKISIVDTDTDTEGEILFSSRFTDVEKGNSFTWDVNELSVTVEGTTAGVAGQIKVSADPGTVQEPEDARVVLELTQGGLLDLFNEVAANAQIWSEQFAPEETEVLYEDDLSGETDVVYDDGAAVETEAADDAGTSSVTTSNDSGSSSCGTSSCM